MSESKSSYHRIIKSTTLFGGVQVFSILISIIRSKFVAIFIGPTGMGILGLLNSTLNLINGFTNLGLENSSVKYISQFKAERDETQLGKTIYILKKLMWITGILGSVFTIIASSWLSKITFGNFDYTYSFVIVAITLLFKQLSVGQLSILQGLQKLQHLAKANFLGSLFGLIFSIPLYYKFKLDAIVPTLLVSSLTTLFFAYYYGTKVEINSVKVAKKTIYNEGKSMINLGLMFSLSSIFTLFSLYLLQIYIGYQGGITQVGLYSAGFTLLNSYVGLIFSSMGTDYFPRLSVLSEKNDETRTMVNQQGVIAILIILPIVVLFLTFASLIVKIILAIKFIAIIPMICIGILGMIFRAASWSIGFILLARGDSKIFIKTSFGFNILFIVLHIVGYHFYGLFGLGLAFLIHYIFHYLILKWIVFKRYQFYFDAQFKILFLISILISGTTYAILFIDQIIIKFGLLSLMILISLAFSFFQLNKRIDFKEIINKLKQKLKR